VVEVDGRVGSLALWMDRPVRDGMTIHTDSPALRNVVQERLTLLREGHCYFIRQCQEFAALEAEASGLVNLEKRSQWRFEPRISWPSIYHDPNLCVRCQACVDTCNNFQGVGALRFDEQEGVLMDEARCTRCGQCIHSCPTGFRKVSNVFVRLMGCASCPYQRPMGAMREIDDTAKVWAVLHDPQKFPVVEMAPAVRATLGEEFGLPPGTLTTRRLYAAFRRLGFRRVWDTNFSADLTIMEEGHELIHRLQQGGKLPMFTSCSPGWIRYCETFYPDLLPHLSTAKSPQQMFGAVAKTFAAQALGVDPRQMVVVSIMPCTAKKAEAAREEMDSAYRYWSELGKVQPHEHFQDVDYVLTSREAAKLLKMAKISLADLPEEDPDPLLGRYTGAATIFGRTGGVMEAALRTAYELVTGKTLAHLEFEPLGTMEGVKTAMVPLDGLELRVAVVHGLGNARKVCESVQEGGQFAQFHFIEFMACEGGCIGGGGQPVPTNLVTRQIRAATLNAEDRLLPLRKSHLNPEIQQIYNDFLHKPLGKLPHRLLHTHYLNRSQALQPQTAPARD
ncbi:MAG: [FeFe] hydrogenase, group A, partial [Thermoguttaceae bacterium]|nr:[FeFe] hydrogenase, group A [Thermoguttaceae bacterium]